MGSTVTRMRLTFDEAVLLKFVEKPNHCIAVDGQRVGQLLLSLTFEKGELAEHCELTGL